MNRPIPDAFSDPGVSDDVVCLSRAAASILGEKGEVFEGVNERRLRERMEKMKLRNLSRRCHGLWLLVFFEPTIRRFRGTKFSFVSPLKALISRQIVSQLLVLLSDYVTGFPSRRALKTARSLTGLCHDYDIAPGVFGVDCRAVFSIAVHFEDMLQEGSCETKLDSVYDEEELLNAYRLAEAGPLDYVATFESAYARLVGNDFPTKDACDWITQNLNDPDLLAIVRRCSDADGIEQLSDSSRRTSGSGQ